MTLLIVKQVLDDSFECFAFHFGEGNFRLVLETFEQFARESRAFE